MQVPRFPRLRFGITGSVVLWGLAALLVTFPLIAAITWSLADEHAHTEIDQELDEDLQIVQSDLQEKTRDLATLGRWLVERGDFNNLMQSREDTQLTELLGSFVKAGPVDFLQVVDLEGHIVWQENRDRPILQASKNFDYPEIVRATSGLESLALAVDTLGEIKVSLILPIYEDNNDSHIGGLILGFYLNRDSFRNLLKKEATNLAVVYKDRIAVSTLADQRGNPLVGQIAPTTIIDAAQTNRATDLMMIETEQERYFSKFKPLQFSFESPSSMIGVAVPITSFESKRLALLRTLGLGVFGTVMVILALGFLSTRMLAHPIRDLTTATQKMVQGNLSTAISLKRDDELGELARQLDILRQQNHQVWQSALFEKERYAAVIHSMTIPVVITTEDHLINMCNPAAEAILMQSQADLINHPWPNFFALSDKDEASMPPFWRLNMVGPEKVGTVIRGRFPLRAQPQIVLDIISTPIQVDGKTVGFVHSLKDVTKIEEFDRVKDEFLLNVAHELESPLSSWRASLDLLVEDYNAFSQRDLGVMLRTLQRSAMKFQGLVERLIDMGKLQAGKFRVRPTSVAIQQLVQDASSQIKPLLQSKGQRLELHLHCSAGCAVFADSVRVLQVLINFLKNASKYSPEDQPIVLSTYRQGAFVFFEVTDCGQGIPAEEQGHLFQRFYRTKRAEQEGAGLGLGLALAKGIVEAHGGQIGVRSRVGEGAIFWFSLPEAYPS